MKRLRSTTPARLQAGFTLVEILVALTVGLIVAAAAVAALLIGRQGFTSADSGAQLRENARFAASLIQRITIQAGFENLADGIFPSHGFPVAGSSDQSYLRGFDDAVVPAASGDSSLAHGSRSTGCVVTDTSCKNGSDVLVIRYKGASRSGAADNSMIDCSGQPEPEGTATQPYSVSILNVKRSAAGEPTLMCTYQDVSGAWKDVPLVQGVEAFQVLYGTDGVSPNVDSVDPDVNPTTADTIPDRYLRASQLDNAAGGYSRNNWARVRSLRIGLLLRGPVGSAVDRAATEQTYAVLGTNFSLTGDPLSTLAVPADGRLRQQLIFTVHLRNPQSTP